MVASARINETGVVDRVDRGGDGVLAVGGNRVRTILIGSFVGFRGLLHVQDDFGEGSHDYEGSHKEELQRVFRIDLLDLPTPHNDMAPNFRRTQIPMLCKDNPSPYGVGDPVRELKTSQKTMWIVCSQ